MAEEEIVKQIVKEVLNKINRENKIGEIEDIAVNNKERILYCNYSNRHCHISREHLDILYGEGYQLTKLKDLIQPGEFASNELLTIVGPTGAVLPIRILGPVRSKTQVEISRTDSFAIKIKGVPVRQSGNTAGTPGCVLVGPNGAATLKEGVVVAMRHVHFTPDDARYFDIRDKEMLKVRLESPARTTIFEKVVARVKPSYALEMHIDVDEANAAGVGQNTPAEIIKD
ncbi:MAG: phosphate propanoyltransferase [Candidatus Eremiobacteraeota bacterium]|nr:phosphate propanoyltransferase [Candidatus Eremiobacteraeota bacterium]